MSDLLTLECLLCGECCRNLLKIDGKVGLMLFPDETPLFNGETKPGLGVGINPFHKNFRILTYQHTKPVCKYLKKNKCTIYEKRPIVCRAYPVSIDYNWKEYTYKVSHDCKFIQEVMKNHSDGFDVMPSDETKNAKNIMDRLTDFSIFYHQNDKRWMYDLQKDRWKVYSKS